jgi:hypothetical protein
MVGARPLFAQRIQKEELKNERSARAANYETSSQFPGLYQEKPVDLLIGWG